MDSLLTGFVSSRHTTIIEPSIFSSDCLFLGDACNSASLASVQWSLLSDVSTPTGGAKSVPACAITREIWCSSCASERGLPDEEERGTEKNLFLRAKTTWLLVAASYFFALSEGLTGYRVEWKLSFEPLSIG